MWSRSKRTSHVGDAIDHNVPQGRSSQGRHINCVKVARVRCGACRPLFGGRTLKQVHILHGVLAAAGRRFLIRGVGRDVHLAILSPDAIAL